MQILLIGVTIEHFKKQRVRKCFPLNNKNICNTWQLILEFQGEAGYSQGLTYEGACTPPGTDVAQGPPSHVRGGGGHTLCA